MYQFMLEIHIAGIIVCIYMLQLLLRRKERQSNTYIVLAIVLNMMLLIGYVFELVSTNVSEMLLAIQIGYMGKCFAGASFVTGIGKYYNWKYKRFTLPVLWGIGFLSFGIIMTAKYHNFYYTSVGMIWKDGHAFCSLGKAPYYYFFFGYLSFIFIYFAVRCLRHRKLVKTPDEKSVMTLVGYGSIAAVIAVIGVLFLPSYYDFGPLVFAAYSLVFLYCVLRYRLFDTVDTAIYQMAAESAQALIVAQEDGYVVYANHLAERIMTWLVEWDRVSIAEKVKADFLGGAQECRINDRDYQISVSEVSDNGSVAGYAVTLTDITRLRQYTMDLERLSDKANEANQAKSYFLANMSHEIRTPINTMLGMNEMIAREAVSGEVISYSQNIREAGRSLLAIINDILDFSKIESGKMEIIPANYEVSDIIYDLYNMIELKLKEKNLEFVLEIDSGLPSGLRGDDVRIRQIILNLLSNAVKYTDRGRVTMRMSGKKEEKFILHVEVEDTGIGVREEDMDKIFSSFQRLEETKNRNIEGTGLGMSITTSFLFMMGSELCLESEYGKGSRFYFDLEQEIVDETPLGSIEHILAKRKENRLLPGMSFEAPAARILVVDDNRMNLEVFKGLLKHTRMQIVAASDGREALDLFAQQQFDMVFMDHMMPEMDGIETFEEMKRLWKQEPEKIQTLPGIPVVILTANAIYGARERYLEQGFTDYLSKPIDYQKLEEIVTGGLPQEKVIFVEKQEQIAGDEVTESAKKQASIEDERFRYLKEYGIHVEEGLKHMAGSVETYEEILKIYFEELPEKMERLRKSGTMGDMKAYSIDVHSLKSTSYSIGAQQLADMAREHERQSRVDNSLYVRQHMNRLCAECKKMIKVGEKFLEM